MVRTCFGLLLVRLVSGNWVTESVTEIRCSECAISLFLLVGVSLRWGKAGLVRKTTQHQARLIGTHLRPLDVSNREWQRVLPDGPHIVTGKGKEGRKRGENKK